VGPKTIVVVDDESHMLDTIQFILEANGYTAVTARGGEEALELIERLRETGEKAPVLVMTGYNDRETTRKLRERGCEHFLDKPFEEEELLRRISELA